MTPFEHFLSYLPDFLLKFFVAIVCGGLIGIERERKGKAAGLRTNILICLGAALYMIISEFIAKAAGQSSDPARVAAQVVTGIGFIGAGAIIQSRGTVTGLTTAATIWVVAAIGLTVGAGFHAIALSFTVLVLVTLTLLGRFEHKLLGRCHFVTCEIVHLDDGGKTQSELNEIFEEYNLSMSSQIVSKRKGRIYRTLTYCDRHLAHSRVISDLWKTSGVVEVKTTK